MILVRVYDRGCDLYRYRERFARPCSYRCNHRLTEISQEGKYTFHILMFSTSGALRHESDVQEREFPETHLRGHHELREYHRESESVRDTRA